jgi:mRNA-degrading endonuclease toxin of MazEF toxin-antitoxin module
VNPWPLMEPMQRGEVWWVSFTENLGGGEGRKPGPAVIVSNNTTNQHANCVQVVPFSSNTGQCYPYEAIVTVDGRNFKAPADQLMTVSKDRLVQRQGLLAPHDLHRVDSALRLQLGLPV